MREVGVIMAGGVGSRLWPLSRADRPKQLLRLFGGKSLLQLAYERLREFLPAESILVIAADRHLPAIALELPELSPGNLIGEPEGRDTANAVALAAAVVEARWPGSVMGVFTADHVIAPVDRFVAAVRAGYSLAATDPAALVTFGVKATEALTGLGYVQRGEAVGGGAFLVKEFKEKPDAATAARYLASGDYYWNSGMFVWQTATILEQIRARLPETHAAVTEVAREWPGEAGMKRLAAVYPGLRKISIDFAVMEHAPRVVVVEMDVAWHDLGAWTSLPAVRGRDEKGNTAAGENVVLVDAANNIVVSPDEHLIVALGVHDLVVVRSADATLICRASDVQRIKDLVGALEGRYGDRYS